MEHWSDRFVGVPYVEETFDCGELARTVRAEVFGQPIELPRERDYAGKRGVARVRAMRDQIAAHRDDYATPTVTPCDGDGVLLQSRGRLDHIGLYCLIGGEAWVLHAAAGIDQVVRTRVRQLELSGYRLEGYYRWK